MLAEGADALEAGLGGGDGGHDGDPLGQGAGADLDLLAAGDGPGWRVDHQGDFPVFHQVDHVGAPLGEFEKGGDGNTGIGQLAGGAFAGDDAEAQFVQALAQTDGGGFVAVADAQENGSGEG